MSKENEYRRYAEDVALHFEQGGLSRTAGRIFGWLLICDPPRQTMDDVAEGLQVSKSSVSTATRLLIQVGLIERLSLPGERRDYYCVSEGVWQTIMRERETQVTAFRRLAEQGLDLLVDEPAERRERLQEMRDFYAFFEEELPVLLDRWEAERKES